MSSYRMLSARSSRGSNFASNARIALFLFLFGLTTVHASWASEEASSAADPAADAQPAACTSSPNAQLRRLAGVITDQKGSGIGNAKLTLACGDFRVNATADSTGNYS